MQSDYYLNGAHPGQPIGKRITAGFAILAADGSGEFEPSSAERTESKVPAGFSEIEIGYRRDWLQDILAA